MESNTSLGKIVSTNGIIAGAILFVVGLLYYLFEISYFNLLFIPISFIISFGIIIAFAVIGTRAYRDKLLGGQINYGKKFISVFLISLIAVLLSTILNYLFFEFVDPEYIAGQAEEFLISMEERGLSDEQLSEIEQGFEEQGFTPLDTLLQGLKVMPAVAAILSLIVAATIKSDTTLPK